MKKLLFSILSLMLCIAANAQIEFSANLITKAGSAEGEIVFNGKIAPV